MKSHFREGRLKVVALADVRRSPQLPEIPTTAEAGLPGLVATAWFALAAPPKLAPALASTIARDAPHAPLSCLASSSLSVRLACAVVTAPCKRSGSSAPVRLTPRDKC